MNMPRTETAPGATVAAGANVNRDPTIERATASAHETVDRVAATVGPAVERMRTAAEETAETLQTKMTELGAMSEDWIEATRDYVRERPMTALGVAMLAGFLLARMARSS